MKNIRTSYLDDIYNIKCYTTTVKKLTESIKTSKLKFDSIVFRGSSGAAVAFPLSLAINKPLTHVRKDKGHYGSTLEGLVYPGKYIIVDDIIASGNTIRKIIKSFDAYKKMFNIEVKDPKCVGIFLYSRRNGLRYHCDYFDFKKNKIPVFQL